MTLGLIHPSRGRPQKAYVTYKKWIDFAGHSDLYVNHILSIDRNDTKAGEYKGFFGGEKSYVLESNNNSVVEATNHAAKESKSDILLYLSDDFDCFENWSVSVLKEFEGVTEPMLLKVDDCLQSFNVPVLTIPIMNRALYNKLGYFWHPGYKSMFVDEDLYWTAHNLGALKFAPHLKFEHQHVSVGKAQDDETYRRSAANWDQGKAFFRQRKAQGFPL